MKRRADVMARMSVKRCERNTACTYTPTDREFQEDSSAILYAAKTTLQIARFNANCLLHVPLFLFTKNEGVYGSKRAEQCLGKRGFFKV
jgi:D-lyxose ketol-isomerase